MYRLPVPARSARAVRGLLSSVALAAACTDATAPADDRRVTALRAAADAPRRPAPSVVMWGLDNPRGLAVGPDGAIYVAESGRTTLGGACVPTPPRGETCYSGTGAISRLRLGRQRRIVDGLPSVFLRIRQRDPVTGEERVLSLDATGPHRLAVGGAGAGVLTMGWGTDPALRAALGPAAGMLGHLVRFHPNGAWRVQADLAAFEAASNPDGRGLNSNPYGLAVARGRTYVADAGGNTVVQVGPDGTTSLLAVFPRLPRPAGLPGPELVEAVPTAVRRGPDDALYVSTLTGVPFVDGLAGIYRIAEDTPPRLVAGGFKTVIDFDVARDGTLFVLQHASSPFNMEGPGRVVRVSPSGLRTVLLDDLAQPTAILLGRDGALYVTNYGTTDGKGRLLRLPL